MNSGKNKMRVSFMTDSGFFSHKQEILKGLNQRVQLQVIVFFVEGLRNFSKEDIRAFAKTNNISLTLADKGKRRARDPRRVIHDYRSVIKPIRQFQPDICYIESFGSPYINLLSAIFLPRKRVIIGIHDYLLHEVEKSKVPLSARIYQKLAIMSFSHFHFFSSSQRALFQADFAKKQTHVIRLFLVGTSYARPQPKVYQDHTHFLFFGRIYHYKGVDLLIEAAQLLKKQYGNFTVTLAGKTSSEREILERIDEPDIFNLHLNFVPKEEIARFFNKADFFVAPYREVTQSGPLLIGYNYDIIPIASDKPGFQEYIDDGRTGLLFKSGSAQALAVVMERAIKMKKAEKTEMLGRISEFKSREFDQKEIINRYLQMFLSTANR